MLAGQSSADKVLDVCWKVKNSLHATCIVFARLQRSQTLALQHKESCAEIPSSVFHARKWLTTQAAVLQQQVKLTLDAGEPS